MKMSKKYSFYKKVSIVLLVALINQIVFPTVALALTSGPTSPEFSSFEPVATTGMVNEFSGDFTYNIPVLNVPGPDGSGYSLSLSYHSGENVEGEASWVGYGWTLNPGAINRGKSGFPDDANGDQVQYFNNIPANWTLAVGLNASASLEAFSIDGIIGLSANHMARFNNYRGFSRVSGVNVSVLSGLASVGTSISDGQSSYSANINPAALVSLYSSFGNGFENLSKNERIRKTKRERKKMTQESVVQGMIKGKAISAIGTMSAYSFSNFQDVNMPVNISPYEGTSISFNANLQVTPAPVPVGLGFGINGSLSSQTSYDYERNVFGYMYSGNAIDIPQSQMDYSVEKESTYNKRDKYLSIPFSSADSYNCTGEGVVGSFRLHSKNVGHFRPNLTKNATIILQEGVEGMVGLTNGVGANISVGDQQITVSGDWDEVNGEQPISSQYVFSKWNKDDEYFMRFNNDLGGDVKYGNNIKPERASIKTANAWLIGKKRCIPTSAGVSVPTKLTSYKNQVNRSGRSSYIAYNTNSEMSEIVNNVAYKSYDKISRNKNTTVRNQVLSGIGEVSIYNEDGHRFLYGLPIYSQNEVNVQYFINASNSTKENNSRATLNSSTSSYPRSGSKYAKPYATTYLITEITTPDYVDVNFNGADDSDFGGYTRFVYNQKKDASNDEWFKWRVPYNGVNYEAGDMVDLKDDKGIVSYGEKQLFYLDSIITKTHFAKFYKSSRLDGCPASKNEEEACSTYTAKGDTMQSKLDSIVLYAKGATPAENKVLQKVCFQYDYSLCQHILNQKVAESGKLTLRKVWFEYEGVCNSKITPYEFNYNYPDAYSGSNQKYSMPSTITNQMENPDYSSFCLDRWGFYEADGPARKSALNPWVNQHPGDFDPAAWALKVIKLPSGGEIHVQYEQKDYLYVQDRRATSMVKIEEVKDVNDEPIPGNYYLKLDDCIESYKLGDIEKWLAVIKDEIFNKPYSNGRIYYKLLYSLTDKIVPSVLDGESDWISGYAPVKAISIENGKIKIELKDGYLPSEICEDFVSKTKNGIIKANELGFDDQTPPMGSVLLQMLGQLTGITGWSDHDRCKHIDSTNSFFKVPMLKEKKGGGYRVKRILMYDDGMETEDQALYGTEYIYKDENGFSSGVASNEPTSGRDENALVTYLEKREEQTTGQRLASGKDMDQFEGPIGESLLPSPSIGYSRVLVKNIHSGKTNSGLKELLFYTYKDYPFDKYYSKLGQNGVSWTDPETENDKHTVSMLILNINVANIWTTQGYSFINYNINGQKKAERTYTYASKGDISNEDLIKSLVNPANLTLSAEVVYTYFEPGEKIKLYKDVESFVKNITDDEFDPGVEMEVTMESRSVEDITSNCNVEGDLNIGLIGGLPMVYPTFFGSETYNEAKIKTHVITKTVSYPAIQKSVRTYSNGVHQYAENIGFDSYTSKPNVVRNYDVYDNLNLPSSQNHKGWLTTVNVNATSTYPSLRQKAVTENSMITSLNSTMLFDSQNKTITIAANGSANQCDLTRSLSAGDLIKVGFNSDFGLYNIDSVGGDKLFLVSSYIKPTPTTSTSVGYIQIIRSGKTNQLNLQSESYTLYGDNYLKENDEYSTLQSICNEANTRIESYSTISYSPTVCGGSVAFIGTVINSIVNFESKCCAGKAFSFRLGSARFVADPSGAIYLEKCNGERMLYCKPCNFGGRYLVISSSAKTYSDLWTNINATNRWEWGDKGKWREHRNYVYKQNTYHRDYAYTDPLLNKTFGGNTYNATGAYWITPFVNSNPDLNTSEWLNLSTVNQYNSNGNPLEEVDILGAYSAVRFGYNNLFPKVIAKNAMNNEIRFIDFEYQYLNGSTRYIDDGIEITIGNTSNNAHTGKQAYSIPTTGEFLLAQNMSFGNNTNKAVMKMWTKRLPNGVSPNLTGTIYIGSTTVNSTSKVIASSGDWVLVEYIFDLSSFTTVQKLTLNVKVKNNASQAQIIDDILIRPYEAQVSCFVYDKVRYKPIATFDDSHFALLYQYNSEGKLVRKLKETVKGVKTIQETQYNTPTRNRN